MTIEERLSGKSSDELNQLMTDVERERNDIENKNDIVDNEISNIEREILRLGREISTLRSRKKDLEDTARVGRKLVRDKKLDERITNRAFWSSRRNGSI